MADREHEIVVLDGGAEQSVVAEMSDWFCRANWDAAVTVTGDGAQEIV
ncbi:MAG TPA: hypothetical protein VNA25_16745 [Phycisphaerae bacterium]|nr:hypothetical protein [Phycisphaerae bacterium]